MRTYTHMVERTGLGPKSPRNFTSTLLALEDHRYPEFRNPTRRGGGRYGEALPMAAILPIRNPLKLLGTVPSAIYRRVAAPVRTTRLERAMTNHRLDTHSLDTVSGSLHVLGEFLNILKKQGITADMATVALGGGMPEIGIKANPLEMIAAALPVFGAALVAGKLSPGDIVPEVSIAGLGIAQQALLHGRFRSGVNPANRILMACWPTLCAQQYETTGQIKQLLSDYFAISSANLAQRRDGEMAPNEVYLMATAAIDPLAILALYAKWKPLDRTYQYVLEEVVKPKNTEWYNKLIGLSKKAFGFLTADTGVLNDAGTKEITKVLEGLPLIEMVYLRLTQGPPYELSPQSPLKGNKPDAESPFFQVSNKQLNDSQGVGPINKAIEASQEIRNCQNTGNWPVSEISMSYKEAAAQVGPLLIAMFAEGKDPSKMGELAFLGEHTTIAQHLANTWAITRGWLAGTPEQIDNVFKLLDLFWVKSDIFKRGGSLPRAIMDLCDGGQYPAGLRFVYSHIANSVNRLFSTAIVNVDSIDEDRIPRIQSFVMQTAAFINKRLGMLGNIGYQVTNEERNGILRFIEALYKAWNSLSSTVNWQQAEIDPRTEPNKSNLTIRTSITNLGKRLILGIITRPDFTNEQVSIKDGPNVELVDLNVALERFNKIIPQRPAADVLVAS